MKRTIFISTMILAAAWSGRVAAGDDAGGTTSPFSLGAGCRSIAMGGASSAVWGDSYALFWNPAGLYSVERDEANLFHTSLFDESATYSAVALSHPFLDFGVISFGAIQLRVGGIEQRDAANMVVGGDLTNVQTRFALGYAQRIVQGVTAGFSCKLDRFTQFPYSANGFGIDAGLGVESTVRSPAIDGVSFGAAVHNAIEPTINLVEQEAGDPLGVRAGLSIWRAISAQMRDRLTLAVDIDKTRFTEARIHLGAEYRMRDLFAVRGGWGAGVPTFGFGCAASHLTIDYAYRSTDLGGNHLFSLAFGFGASRSEKKERAQRRREEEIRAQIEAEIMNFERRSIESALGEGEALLRNKDYAGAADRFRRALLWSPSNEPALEGLRRSAAAVATARGDSLMDRGAYAEALFAFREAHNQYPTNETSDRIRRCETRVRESSDAERIREEMLAKAIELYAHQNWTDAVLAFRDVLEADPGHRIASDYLVRCREKIQAQYAKMFKDADRLAAEGRFGSAIQILSLELEKNPTDVRIETKIAEIKKLQRQEDIRRAEEQAARTAVTPLSAEERDRLRRSYEDGIASFTRGDFARAINAWEGIFRVAPSFEKVSEYLVKAYQYFGMEQYARHEYEKAIETWNKILVVDHDNEKAIRYINKTKEELSRLEGYTIR